MHAVAYSRIGALHLYTASLCICAVHACCAGILRAGKGGKHKSGRDFREEIENDGSCKMGKRYEDYKKKNLFIK